MDDTISRRAAIDAIISLCDDCDSDYCGSCRVNFPGVKDCRKVLEDLPSAQPESAQWVQMLINPNLYKCSNCQVAWNKRLVFDNEGYSENIFMKYCPCCGRKMQTEVDYE